MQAHGNVIFLISNEEWGPVWYSKHHYAHALAQHNTVYFVNPSLSWRPTDLLATRLAVAKVQENLFSVHYSNPFPVRLKHPLVAALNDRAILKRLRNLATPEVGGHYILWQFDPARLFTSFQNFWPELRLLYHAVDPYQNFSTDTALAQRAHLVVAINSDLQAYYEKLTLRVIMLPHGYSALQKPDEDKAAKLRAQYAPAFLLVGTMNHDLDFELLQQIARRFPKHRLLLVGPDNFMNAEFKQRFHALLEGNPNIVYIGSVHARELPNWIAIADACLILYQFGMRKTVGTRTPHKLMDYLSGKRPVVSTMQGLVPALENKAIWAANDAEGLLSLLTKAAEGQLVIDAHAIDEYLDSVSYERHLTKIFEALPEATSHPLPQAKPTHG
jgi:glycosyltransferase involved in cell wall biosynthesis